MKIVVFSDSHGAVSNMEDVMRREHPELPAIFPERPS